MKDGKPVVTWDPTPNGKNADGTYIRKGVREYAIKGSADLKDWHNVDDGEEGNYNFFKVIVEMPKVE